jgi:hypothetical protein
MQDLQCDYLSKSLERTSGSAHSGGEWFRSITDGARSITRSLRVMKTVRIAHAPLDWRRVDQGRVRSYRSILGQLKMIASGTLLALCFCVLPKRSALWDARSRLHSHSTGSPLSGSRLCGRCASETFAVCGNDFAPQPILMTLTIICCSADRRPTSMTLNSAKYYD